MYACVPTVCSRQKIIVSTHLAKVSVRSERRDSLVSTSSTTHVVLRGSRDAEDDGGVAHCGQRPLHSARNAGHRYSYDLQAPLSSHTPSIWHVRIDRTTG